MNEYTYLTAPKITCEELRPGYLYQAAKGKTALFIGHVSTIKLTPSTLKPNGTDKDFETGKNCTLTEFNKRGFEPNSKTCIKTSKIEYGMLFFDIPDEMKWIFQYPDLNSKEVIEAFTVNFERRVTSDIYVDPLSFSIRERNSFVSKVLDYKFDLDNKTLIPKISNWAYKELDNFIYHFGGTANIHNHRKTLLFITALASLTNMVFLGIPPNIDRVVIDRLGNIPLVK